MFRDPRFNFRLSLSKRPETPFVTPNEYLTDCDVTPSPGIPVGRLRSLRASSPRADCEASRERLGAAPSLSRLASQSARQVSKTAKHAR